MLEDLSARKQNEMHQRTEESLIFNKAVKVFNDMEKITLSPDDPDRKYVLKDQTMIEDQMNNKVNVLVSQIKTSVKPNYEYHISKKLPLVLNTARAI